MELATTFRGLNAQETGSATRALERQSARLDRLVDTPTTLRAVIEGPDPEYCVKLNTSMRGSDLQAEENGHDLAIAISGACEKLRVQMVRARHRRESQRHRPADPA